MFYWELEKILKSKTGAIVFALFIFLTVSMFFMKPTLETENTYRNDKFELIIDSRQEEIIAQEKLDNRINRLKAISKMKLFEPSMQYVSSVAQNYLESVDAKEYQDVNFYKVFDHRSDHPLASIIILMSIILIFSSIYTSEKESDVDHLILSSKNKMKVLHSKLLLAVTLPTVLYGAYVGAIFLMTMYQYGNPTNGGLEVVRILDAGLMMNRFYTIGEYIALKIATMLLVFTGISVMTCFFSLISESTLGATSSALVFVTSGKVVSHLKFMPDAIQSLSSKCNYVELILYPDRFIGMFVGYVNILGKSLETSMLGYLSLFGVFYVGVILCKVVFNRVLCN